MARNKIRISCMKRYKVEYLYNSRKSIPLYISEINKSGIYNEDRNRFSLYGKKCWQVKFKNGSLNGLCKEWSINSKNIYFQNWKKGNRQGIEINFK